MATASPRKKAPGAKKVKAAKAAPPAVDPVLKEIEDAIAEADAELKDKHLAFVERYCESFDAKQAAIEAGYSERSAKEIGYGLLQKPRVQEAIRLRQRQMSHKSGITRQRVIEECAKLAFSDIREVFNEDGTLKRVHDFPDGIAGAVSSIEVEELFEGVGKDRVWTGYVKKLKLWDKNPALEKLLKHLGLDEADKDSDLAALMKAIASSSNGGRLQPR